MYTYIKSPQCVLYISYHFIPQLYLTKAKVKRKEEEEKEYRQIPSQGFKKRNVPTCFIPLS